MNIIKDKILHSSQSYDVVLPKEKRIVDHLLNLVRDELETQGDRNWLTNVQTNQSIKVKCLMFEKEYSSMALKPIFSGLVPSHIEKSCILTYYI